MPALLDRARFSMRGGGWAAALSDLEMAISLGEDSADAWNDCGALQACASASRVAPNPITTAPLPHPSAKLPASHVVLAHLSRVHLSINPQASAGSSRGSQTRRSSATPKRSGCTQTTPRRT